MVVIKRSEGGTLLCVSTGGGEGKDTAAWLS